jgi:hypothetical protein
MKQKLVLFFLLISAVLVQAQNAEKFITNQPFENGFELVVNKSAVSIVIDKNEKQGVHIASKNLQTDFQAVTGNKVELKNQTSAHKGKMVLVGTLGSSSFLADLIKKRKIDKAELLGKREKFIIQIVVNPFPDVDEALVIAGSDMRGTIYGIYELSEQMGVSPWYYWADIPVRKSESLYVKRGKYTAGEPAVKYRGIFLNDEAPALTGWVNMTFGGYNHKFYQKVFELLLRLRANYLWPAMWDAAFYDDDPQNSLLADQMGIVMGTSHHEPLARAHKEWKRYGKGPWNYAKNATVLDSFWTKGVERMKNTQDILTIGMRGDGDEPMSEESNIKLLEQIVSNQRNIIGKITGKKASETPQLWALYKEVQDYYDKGMRVPDDVTLLLCDDNWGNVRKLPAVDATKRKGGYGMYYHFDYVGDPRNYKWLNVNPVQRIWEQMNLTYSHGVDQIWIVNVGDLKPMEYPISFFMDMAWNPAQFNSQNLLQHTQGWCAEQFGEQFANESARLINLYAKYNRRVTPELLNDTIYSLNNYNEFEKVTNDYKALALDAYLLNQQIPQNSKDAFEQLILYPVTACANLYELYFAVAKNKELAALNDTKANNWADVAKRCYVRDSILTNHYNREMAGGKWNHMMDQIHIGYTYWQQPEKRVMPEIKRVETSKISSMTYQFVGNLDYVSIEAEYFTRKLENARIHWEVIPDFGKTLSGITTFPANAYPTENEQIALEYDFKLPKSGEINVSVLVAPTLNFNGNKGLRYAISVDGGAEQVMNINGKYDANKMRNWEANSINVTRTKHTIAEKNIHTLKIRVLEPGIVIEKILIDAGGLKPSYLGAPETKVELAK